MRHAYNTRKVHKNYNIHNHSSTILGHINLGPFSIIKGINKFLKINILF